MIRRMATPRAKKRPTDAPTWIGGSVQSEAWAFDPDAYRPELVLWVRGDEVLASATVHPSERDEALGACLRDALAKSKTRPAAVRVADAEAASVARGVLRDVPVRVGETPELDEVAKGLLPPASEAEDSYLAGGRVDPSLVGAFFSAAAAVFRAAPWSVVPDDTVLFAFDAPSLDVSDAAVIVVGQRSSGRGLLMFDGVDEYLAFERAAVEGDDRDQGAALFAISFADALSERRAAEIAAHRWELPMPGPVPVGAPVIERFEPDGTPRPLVARDLLVATALCRVFTLLAAEHPQRLAASTGPAVSAIFPAQRRGNAAISQLTLPHPGAESFEAAMAPRREVSALVRDFLASEVRGRVPGAWRDAAEALSLSLLDEKRKGSGPRFDRWPLRLVDEAMARALDALEDARSRRLAIDALDRFFAWMEATGRLTPALSERLHERARAALDAAVEEAAPAESDDETVDGEALPPGLAEWARGAIRDAKT